MTGPWWQSAVIYEIYPRSFQDSDGDGVGDLAGIIERVDYLAWLGVDAVWVTPIYPSPMADFGYDVADYTGIHPLFGTLADFDRLVAALHAKGIKLILDLVPNHTSEQHPWFQESRSSRSNPKRDWYLWRDPAPDGGPPNNWVSIAGGKAWQLDPATGQYYCHLFLKEQPDLNWRNPEVREAIYDAMRFWLERGVDGFRIDVFWLMIKDDRYRDDPVNPDYVDGQPDFRRVLPTYSADRPEIHEIAREMRAIVDSYRGERLLIGEIYLPVEKLVAYYGEQGVGLQLPFNFNLMWQKWNAAALRGFIERYESVMPAAGWPSWVLGNHDQKRIASRIGSAQARIAMLLLLTLRGTPTLYYGDELGLENVAIPKERLQDPFGQAHPEQGRDPVRTPMPWDDSGPAAGFTAGLPWLPLGADHPARSVARQQAAPGSMLQLTHALLELRRRAPALALGAWAPIDVAGEVLAYRRSLDDQHFLIVLNLEATAKRVPVEGGLAGRIVLTTRLERAGEFVSGQLALAADEGVIVALD